MTLRRINTKVIFFLGIVFFIIGWLIPNKVAAQDTTTLLFDDFSGDTLDPSLWAFFSNSQGAGYLINGGELYINGGYTDGGGGQVASVLSFDVYPDILVFEVRAKTSNRDGGAFAFTDTNRIGRVLFATFDDANYSGLLALTHDIYGVHRVVDISYIPPEDYHIYRIEYSGIEARYFVDDVLVATMSEGVAIMPMRFVMDRVSWGIDEIVTVDYVKLSRQSSTPTPTQTTTPTQTPIPTQTPTPTQTPIQYNFSGFFPPVDNLPVLNEVKAGRAIPVKFSLGGDQGLYIFTPDYPKSHEVSCDSGALIDDIEQTVNAGTSSLSYDPTTDQYVYVWKTDQSWTNTCRQLVFNLNDGTSHMANFKFK